MPSQQYREGREYLATFWSSLQTLIKGPEYQHLANSQEKQIVENLLPAMMRLAKQSKPQAQYFLSCYLEWTANPLANYFLNQAADNGYPDACYKLGKQAFETGQLKQAEDCFVKLLATGNASKIDEMKSLVSDNLNQMPRLIKSLSQHTHNQDYSKQIKALTSAKHMGLFNPMRAEVPEQEVMDIAYRS